MTVQPHVVTPATTDLTAFVGEFPQGRTDQGVFVATRDEFCAEFGDLTATSSLAAHAIVQFFLHGGNL